MSPLLGQERRKTNKKQRKKHQSPKEKRKSLERLEEGRISLLKLRLKKVKRNKPVKGTVLIVLWRAEENFLENLSKRGEKTSPLRRRKRNPSKPRKSHRKRRRRKKMAPLQRTVMRLSMTTRMINHVIRKRMCCDRLKKNLKKRRNLKVRRMNPYRKELVKKPQLKK